MPRHEVLEVDLPGGACSVRVEAAGLDGLGRALAELVPPGRVVLVSNTVVEPLHGDAARRSLEEAGFSTDTLVLPDGEAEKTVETWAHLVEQLLDLGIQRTTPVVALGGGVTGDVVGFGAATALRGVPIVQVPSTLLAMVDAAIGGKTGVNTRHGKNLVGAFHQPILVYAAVELLETLADAEWRSGLGEVVKYGVIADEELLGWLEEHGVAGSLRTPDNMRRLVSRCASIKARVVEQDEKESGQRKVLNFGHTAGHALETWLGHGTLRHGEAVALGMVAETRFAVERGWCRDQDLPGRLWRLLKALGFSNEATRAVASQRPTSGLLDAARMDKKTARGTLTLVAPVRPGQVRLEQLPTQELPHLLAHLESVLEIQ